MAAHTDLGGGGWRGLEVRLRDGFGMTVGWLWGGFGEAYPEAVSSSRIWDIVRKPSAFWSPMANSSLQVGAG